MNHPHRGLLAVGCLALVAGLVWVGCGSSLPQLIFGPNVSGNQPPTLQILEPNASASINQGERLTIRWTDSDPDSAAQISFVLVGVTNSTEVALVASIPENDTAASDTISVGTELVPFGSYYLRGDIDDGVNTRVSVFATVAETATRLVLTVGEPGSNPLSVPPRVKVIAPEFNQSVAQDDTLTVVVRPTTNVFDDTTPFDPDSDATLYVVLDLDENPTNDNPRLPDNTSTNQIILLRQRDIVENTGGEQVFDIPIDLAQVPARPDGSPYYIRATIIDDGNPAVHAYAPGSINVVRSASGVIDLTQIGLTLAGARFIGFNPGARLGSRMVGVRDFDADGIDDFMLVAQYGVPRNIGNLGEGYLIYGLNNRRFGGETNVNTVSDTISGVVFQAPPNRLAHLHPGYMPLGLFDVSAMPDVSGDGRPELLFGLPYVDGIWTGRDDDYGDSPAVEIVEFTLREGLRTRTINDIDDENIGDDNYEGTIDTYVSRNQPNTSFGNDTELQVSAVTVGDATQINEWAIISFTNVQGQFIFRDPDNVTIQSATLEFGPRSFFGGPDSVTVAQLVVPVSENTTFDDFAGGDELGPEADTDYQDEAEVTYNAATGMLEADVTDTITKIITGELETINPSWIIFPAEDADAFNATFDSSENLTEQFRPRLTIVYAEALPEGTSNYNCYADDFPNNRSDPVPQAPTSPPDDTSYEAIGAVVFFNSENRDNDGFINPDRLESVEVPLELVGMPTPTFPLPSAGGLGIFIDEDNDGVFDGAIGQVPIGTVGDPGDSAEGDRARGARITASFWDFYNTDASRVGEATPRADHYGQHVSWIPDTTNDSVPELVISAPFNEQEMERLKNSTATTDIRIRSTSVFDGSIHVLPGLDFGNPGRPRGEAGEQTLPWQNIPGGAECNTDDPTRDGVLTLGLTYDIFAESIDDQLGGAEHAGDVNLDGVPDIVCGAPRNDHRNGSVDTGAVYILYGRPSPGNIQLKLLDDPNQRPPALRIRGEVAGDRLGQMQSSGLDINGDRIDDVFFSSPDVDFGGVSAGVCGDVDGNGVRDGNDLDLALFNTCRGNFGEEVFSDDTIGNRSCKAFDFDNDRDIDDDDRNVFDCLIGGFSNCCPVDNGFVGVIFGNINLDGDRTLSQLATDDLPGVKFFGANAGDRAGADVVSAGDFNRDGFGDLLIAAPGVRFTDANNRDRVGVAYLVFGGTHLNGNRSYSLDQVGTAELPGIIFQTPYFAGRPNEAPIDHVGLLGDINGDGFDDIGLGVTRADFLDSALPQNPNDPGSNPNIGRRPDDGAAFIIYGNNTGSNR